MILKYNFFLWQGAYSPEKGEKFVAEKSPSFTFGAKVKSDRHDNLPGKQTNKRNQFSSWSVESL